MRYALAFITSFTLLLGITTYARVQAGEPPIAEPQASGEKKEEPPKKEEKKPAEDHSGQGKTEQAKDDTKEEKKADPWGGEVKVDLKNAKDPVSGAEIAEDGKIEAVYKGYRVRFADEKSLKKFKRRPVEFFVPLELELTADGEVKQVKAADFKDPPIIPAKCPMMGGDIVAEDGCYMFHRGWRIYFCCWNGCWSDFLKEPTKYYAEYGLQEKDGKLVPLEEKKND